MKERVVIVIAVMAVNNHSGNGVDESDGKVNNVTVAWEGDGDGGGYKRVQLALFKGYQDT